jgi:hypothetical protein
VLHDVAGGAAENHLPQPVPCEGALDQQVAAFRLGRGKDRFILLSQKVAGTDVENQLFEKIHDWRARG